MKSRQKFGGRFPVELPQVTWPDAYGRSMKFACRSEFDRVPDKGFSDSFETSLHVSRRTPLNTRSGSGADALSWGLPPLFQTCNHKHIPR